ncbi:MAG: DUF5752 family protein [Candidatus Omnitrophota bacterium]
MKEFEFIGCMELKELLGKKADDELALMELIEDVPLDSVYFHTHSYFLRPYYLAGQYPTDFANWAAIPVRDRVLGEKLASVMPSRDKTLDDIRNDLIDIIDKHLSEIKIVPSVVYGSPFYFMQSRIIEVPMGITVNDLESFTEALRTVDASAIYYHTYEARLRTRRGRNDFSIWLKDVLGLDELAGKVEGIDYYMYSLESLRTKIVELCEKEMGR